MEESPRELVERLAALNGQTLPPGDIAQLADRLQSLAGLMQPILELDLTDVPSALDSDPRWD